MQIGDEVVRESSVLVERVASLSSTADGAVSLAAAQPEVAGELIALCNALPTQTSSRQLDALMRKADVALAGNEFLAGPTFSIADACLLPFLQRVEDDIPSDAKHLRAYMERAHQLPAFAKTVVSSWWWWW